jgi:hypothetical protein
MGNPVEMAFRLQSRPKLIGLAVGAFAAAVAVLRRQLE